MDIADDDVMALVRGMLNAEEPAICFTVTFIVASSSASAAYLTVSEIMPL